MTIKKRNIPKATFFGKNLRFLRRLMGLSQSALADQAGLTRSNIASYETSIVEPNATNFLAICSHLDVSPFHMMNTELTEHPSHLRPQEKENTSPAAQYAIDEMNSFTNKTNEMTKILEGYRAYYDLQKANIATAEAASLYKPMEQLLDTLDTLIKTNWEMIHQVYPYKEEEE